MYIEILNIRLKGNVEFLDFVSSSWNSILLDYFELTEN